MRDRKDLDSLLKQVGLSVHPADFHLYYQPPESVKMMYPCIVYQRDAIDAEFADDLPYKRDKRYILTTISRDPDDPLVEKISELPMCVFDRRYVLNNLYHDVFSIFY